MNDRERREYESYVRILIFLNKYLNDLKNIVPVMTAKQIFETETQTLADLGIEKVSTTGDARDAVIHKGDLRDALEDALYNVVLMWRPMARNYNNATNKFVMPYGSDQLLIDTAGQFVEDLAPLEQAFLDRGMQPENFIADMTEKRDAFDAVVNESEAARLNRIGVNAQFREPLKRCRLAYRDIDPIIKMVFSKNPAARAEWLSTSHVERR